MRSVLHKTAIPETQLFLVKNLNDKYFDPIWHAHSEYQLFVVLKGSGTRFIGDSIRSFDSGELIFTGPNLPHLWRSDEKHYHSPNKMSSGIVIYFNENFLGNDMLDKIELQKLKLLFEKSMFGMKFTGPSKDKVVALMKQLSKLQGIQSLIRLLQILEILSDTKDYSFISSKNYSEQIIDAHETDRLNKVYKYIIKNYSNKIPLKKMADMLHMTPTSFSRYFSMKNNKTLSRFISEVRIKHACQMLLETDSPITEICYSCGFQTLSNFNKTFKEITQKNPSKYRRAFLDV